MAGGLIGRLVIGVHAQFTERLTVVAADQYCRLVGDAKVVELVHQCTEAASSAYRTPTS